MNELEKVISGLACCTQNVRGQNTRPCDGCPYDVDGKAIACNTQLMADALALLKAQGTTLEKIAADYGLTVDGVAFALDQYQTVICEITHGRMSKLSYYARDILSVANDVKCQDCELQEGQVPHVIPRDAIPASTGAPVWFESRNGRVYTGWALAYDIQRGQGITGERLGVTQPNGHVIWVKLDDYGRTWRLWDKCPTDKQNKAVKWE